MFSSVSSKLPGNIITPPLKTGEVRYQNVVDKGPKSAAELATINAQRATSGQQAADVAAYKERMASGLYAQPSVDTNSSNLNIEKIFNKVSTSISSTTGGGSTTRTSVQNEDAKAAEKQLADLKSQYDADRAALSNKIRETLGPDAKKGDVLKELRVSPEAKALEDRLKIASESLNSRIGSGTSIQTNFEPGITKSQLVTKEQPSLSISEGMKGYNSILGEATEAESDEDSQAIDIADAEPKTKDLHEQLILLNTTMRQLVEHSADGLDKADALRKATSSLSGNRFA